MSKSLPPPLSQSGAGSQAEASKKKPAEAKGVRRPIAAMTPRRSDWKEVEAQKKAEAEVQKKEKAAAQKKEKAAKSRETRAAKAKAVKEAAAESAKAQEVGAADVEMTEAAKAGEGNGAEGKGKRKAVVVEHDKEEGSSKRRKIDERELVELLAVNLSRLRQLRCDIAVHTDRMSRDIDIVERMRQHVVYLEEERKFLEAENESAD
jgi:hypothetical protein